MYAESGKQEPNEYKNKKRAKRSEEKNNTHQLKMKIVLFIAVRLTMATTTTHVRTWCCCCLPLFSTNPFVIHAILPIHSSFFLKFFFLLTARALACRLHHILSLFTWYCRHFCMCLTMFYAYYFSFICLVVLLVYRVCTTTISIL